ncbi:MAG: DnaA N-terminal domain-containing protein [bacterium]|nr:DnaA N-terminal domain-containing protein [bacterium]
MQAISIGYGQFRSPEWLDEIGLSPAERKTYEYLAISSRGADHAWPSQKWLADKVRVTTRSIRTYIRKLEEYSLIRTVLERINGRLRLVYYFLAHPVVKAAVERKNFPVKEEKFSAHLNKRKENIKNPPYPPQREAADAAKERDYEQKIATHADPSENLSGDSRRSPCRTGGRDGLPITGRDSNSVPIGGIRSESKTFQQAATAIGTEKTCPPANTAWQAALALLLQKLPQQEVDLWLAPIQAVATEKGLRLDCPDRYAMAWVQDRFGTDIHEALQQHEITEFYFSFGEQEKELQKEKNQEQLAETARHAERQAQTLRNLPLQEQFTVLVSAYPRKTSGHWFAWQTFKRLTKKGDLPETSELLQMIEAKKQSDDWNRDAGRWIPGLSKWLNNRPWWKIDSREEKKTQAWRSES